MRVASTLAVVVAIILSRAGNAEVRCLATCEYYTSSYDTADSAFFELIDANFEGGGALTKLAVYRVPVFSSGINEVEARSALLVGCLQSAAYLAKLYEATTHSPHVLPDYYCQ